MENQDLNTNKGYKGWKNRSDNRSGRVMGGLVLILVGVVLLAYKMNIVFLPRWFFSWQMIPILVGLFIGFRHSFRNPGWILPVALGVIFLIDDYVPGISFRNYLWPIVIIVIGLWVMLKPRHSTRHYDDYNIGKTATPPYPVTGTQSNTENAPAGDQANYSQDHLDSTAIFGGVKRNVISKNFKGGEVVSVFGGNEINLSQADIQHPVVIDTTQVFGGTSLIIPPHWEVKSEVVAILGGISDKRPLLPGGYDPNKVIILKGTALFGGLDIKSY
ncbi:LiaF transmembrane domain-containing protein [Pontibacter burrus]|uniref:LiaF transmembrane domain-containing protein n=1 Tax=Pontibacter burrus TaxID=2704466 RepID=A0A6B3LJE3_9BACT|nr:LiaF domain-containing protein [Pontibacter burrus]NEM96093.1 hypothetical protein [Pontibacter burrus]